MPSLLKTRGCAPRGTVRETRSPKGKTVNTRFTKNNPLTTPGGIEVTFKSMVFLCVVKTHSCKDRREFARFCSRNGLVYKIPHDVTIGEAWGYQTIVEVSGPTGALLELLEKDIIVSYERPLDVKAPRLTASTFRKEAY